jgi:hypothetical protein
VERKISDVGDRGSIGHWRKWPEFFRLRWEVALGSVKRQSLKSS